MEKKGPRLKAALTKHTSALTYSRLLEVKKLNEFWGLLLRSVHHPVLHSVEITGVIIKEARALLATMRNKHGTKTIKQMLWSHTTRPSPAFPTGLQNKGRKVMICWYEPKRNNNNKNNGVLRPERSRTTDGVYFNFANCRSSGRAGCVPRAHAVISAAAFRAPR